jgi:hypothetical protein
MLIVGLLALLAIGGVVLFLVLRPEPISLIPVVEPEPPTMTRNSIDINHNCENPAFEEEGYLDDDRVLENLARART